MSLSDCHHTTRGTRETGWGKRQKIFGNLPKEQRDPRAKKRKRCYRMCRNWVVMESKILKFSLLDFEKYTK